MKWYNPIIIDTIYISNVSILIKYIFINIITNIIIITIIIIITVPSIIESKTPRYFFCIFHWPWEHLGMEPDA